MPILLKNKVKRKFCYFVAYTFVDVSLRVVLENTYVESEINLHCKFKCIEGITAIQDELSRQHPQKLSEVKIISFTVLN